MPTGRHTTRFAVALAIGIAVASCATRHPAPQPAPPPVASAPSPAPTQGRPFEATAYTIEGKTASGKQTRHGIVAADPKVLPIGSRIRVSDAGQYSGEYEVADTGRAIKGDEIDIYIENGAEARRFGRRNVQVEVIQLGEK